MVLTDLSFAGGDVTAIVAAPIEKKDNSHIYVGLGVVYNQVFSTDYGFFDDSVQTQDETAGLTGLVGYEFNEYIAVEGRYNKTFFERDYSDTAYYSIFLKPQYKFRDEENTDDDNGYFTIYGLIGFGNTQVVGSEGDNDYNAWPEDIGRTMMDETGFQWGIGLSYTFVDDEDDQYYHHPDTWSIFADIVMVVKDADITATKLYDYGSGEDNTLYDKLSVHGITAGILYHF